MRLHSTLSRLAIAASALYAVVGALELAHDQPTIFRSTADYVIEGLFVAALAATVAFFLVLARDAAGIAARVGWGAAAAGQTALFVAVLATVVNGRESLDPLFPLGLLVTFAGYLVLVGLDLRGWLAPPRAGVVLVIAIIAAAVVDNLVSGGGTLVLAAAWAALAGLTAGRSDTAHPLEPAGTAA